MDESAKIVIQQENASPHIATDDPRFLKAVAQGKRSIGLFFQPPNSPDLNVLDLGLFTEIQSRQEQHLTRDFDELMAVVEAAYWELPPPTINATILRLQTTMNKCIEEKGGNDFKF
ncbi:hypothetical protein F441_22009 [Phytophthora nicotianae CJ01A1]|uniref:Tc1-like transposase DDE domain-containing protein n=2 Tax=Phytophthora nicotianae TaxID=4792 RepID=W2VQU7_PHYNI|nr:hypothetical protein L916_09439 [Phytophthora nicotianae]ETP00591.1 hypothetical protein F441_22009 [Phytophthora nicotianae CJ01A1]